MVGRESLFAWKHFFVATTDPASFVATICYSVHAACQNMPDGIMTDHHYSDDI